MKHFLGSLPWLCLAFALVSCSGNHAPIGTTSDELSPRFDLRNLNGRSYVTDIRVQSGGTCWTHATMAAIESNLLMTGNWARSGEQGKPALAEYHLDWWNGFNDQWNPDIAPRQAGIPVHEGGDYRVAAAYLARGDGAVRKGDGQSYDKAPALDAPGLHHFYVRDIEWLTGPDLGPDPAKRQRIKHAIVKNGAIGTAIAWDDGEFYDEGRNTFFQPASDDTDPDHAVAIVGWDDLHATQALLPGAWLAKNSWGTQWGDGGYFWISYHDKFAGRNPDTGAVSFRNVEPRPFHHIYSHDTHGWRTTRNDVAEAMNAFVAREKPERLQSVSFYTTVPNVSYEVTIFRQFDGKRPGDAVETKTGAIDNPGFHTIDLDTAVPLTPGAPFYVDVKLSAGGQAVDQTSDVPVLLGGHDYTLVTSKASPGESFYHTGDRWVDLTSDEKSANFCIKALSIE